MHPPIISAYDELIAEGWIQGEAVGQAKGKAEGKAELLLKQLKFEVRSATSRHRSATAARTRAPG